MKCSNNVWVFVTALIIAFSAGTAASAQTAAELLEHGRKAYLDYNFTQAAKDFTAAKNKAKRADAAFEKDYDLYTSQLRRAREFLTRVEKIAVIDSITVPKAEFFKAYRLPSSAGTLSAGSGLPESDPDVDYVFTNERGDYKLWSAPDSTGNMRLLESMLLTDGGWSRPDTLDTGDNAIYPFMMADGVTLYYADNGKESIGGYDIMVATRDAADGEFLQPQNLGFPYNSPYDDYLLAIDELNNVGWWATDRNRLGDDITIYLFVPNDMRRNYSEDDGDIIGFARIDDYLATQDPESDYDGLLATVRAITPAQPTRRPDFLFPVKGGGCYTHFDDFKAPGAIAAMKKYLAADRQLKFDEERLSDLRRRYAVEKSDTLRRRIAESESSIEKGREFVKQRLSDVYRIEFSGRH